MSFRYPSLTCRASPWLFVLAWLGLLLQPLRLSVDDTARDVTVAQRTTATHPRGVQRAWVMAPPTFDERHHGLAAFDALALAGGATAPSVLRSAVAGATADACAPAIEVGYATQARAPPLPA